MKTICLYFEIHQIIHLKRYRFFDIGIDHYYYDDYENERSIAHIAEQSYMPALNTIQQMIEENGDNLSLGEKQMICIARAILRKSKIVVMDEATASIDIKTEEKIQKALKEIMNESTVITVAHRIKTIIHYDKIIVMDNGKVVEFDTPERLLQNKNSLFYELYTKSVM